MLKGIDDDKIDELVALRLQMSELEKEYNHIRQQMFNKSRSYYHQSIASSFITEASIIDLLTKCNELKTKYNKLSNELKSKRPSYAKRRFVDYGF